MGESHSPRGGKNTGKNTFSGERMFLPNIGKSECLGFGVTRAQW